ncbi:hypothetical protein V5799_019864 [Amblyomma americanum]|uniref:Uncharacterized protein n=1 Tax=Amblyomma americanum TaxID=6943 RepID=A0AAQ4EVB4_AMBAM
MDLHCVEDDEREVPRGGALALGQLRSDTALFCSGCGAGDSPSSELFPGTGSYPQTSLRRTHECSLVFFCFSCLYLHCQSTNLCSF